MAERRRWSTGKRIGYGLAKGGADLAELWMKNIMAEQAGERVARRQLEHDERMALRQGQIQQAGQAFEARQNALKDLPELVDKLGPENARENLGLRLGQPGGELNLFPGMEDPLSGSRYTSPEDVGTGEFEREQAMGQAQTTKAIGASQTPVRRRLEEAVGKAIESAQTPEDVPSIPRILGLAQGVEPTLTDQSPDVRDFVQRAQVRGNALRARPTDVAQGKGPGGETNVRAFSKYDAQTPITLTPTMQEQGTLEGQQQVAKEMVPLNNARYQALRAQREGQYQAIVESLTRDEKAQTAGALESARLYAGIDQNVIDAEVDKASRIAQASGQPTDASNRAAANWTPLINADAMATEAEEAGAAIAPLALHMTGDATMAPFLNRFVSPLNQRYIQSARDFISTFGLIRSGVAVPPAERDSFIASMFAMDKDDPQTAKQKKMTRAVFIGSMQAMVGKSAPQAASILARAINAGQIPMGVLAHLQIEPAIAQAMAPLLTRVPSFDQSFQPIPRSPQ